MRNQWMRIAGAVLAGVVLIGVVGWYFWPQISGLFSAGVGVFTPDPALDGESAVISDYYRDFYRLADEGESEADWEKRTWINVGDDAQMTGLFTVRAEQVSASKQLPDGFDPEMEHWPLSEGEMQTNELAHLLGDPAYNVTADENYTLTSAHLYLDITLSLTAVADRQVYLMGTPVLENGALEWSPTFADLAIYNRQAENILYAYDGPESFAEETHCIQWETVTFDDGATFYDPRAYLKAGDEMRVRLLYIVREKDWNSEQRAVLFAPVLRFNADQMVMAGLDQPYIWLNREAVG